MQMLKILLAISICAGLMGVAYRIKHKYYNNNTQNKIENQIQNTVQIPYKKYMGEYEITFYTHTGNNTASGVYPKSNRTVAVDKNIIPFDSILYIEGYGIRIAEDTGKDIKNNRLDIFVDTKNEAIKNGRKKAKVYIIK